MNNRARVAANVEAAVSVLSIEEQFVLSCVVVKGEDFPDIANSLGVTTDEVARIAFRAGELLTQKLRGYSYDEH